MRGRRRKPLDNNIILRYNVSNPSDAPTPRGGNSAGFVCTVILFACIISLGGEFIGPYPEKGATANAVI